MLVLRRKVDEAIIVTIPPSAETRTMQIMVVEMRGTQGVKLGLTADESITIHRKEIQDIIEAERA